MSREKKLLKTIIEDMQSFSIYWLEIDGYWLFVPSGPCVSINKSIMWMMLIVNANTCLIIKQYAH